MKIKQEAPAPKGCSSFTDAIVVPLLAQACIKALTHHLYYDPACGLKRLRSVSKQFREILQTMIQGYTMSLGGEHDSDLDQQVEFFKTVSLVNLKIVILPYAASGKQGTRLSTRWKRLWGL